MTLSTPCALVVMWKIFDYPCGQRLQSLLEDETEKMRNLGELVCSESVAENGKEMLLWAKDRNKH